MRSAFKSAAIAAALGASVLTFNVANAASLVIVGPADVERELDVNNNKPGIAHFNPGPGTSSVLSQIDDFIDTGTTDRDLNTEVLNIFNGNSNGLNRGLAVDGLAGVSSVTLNFTYFGSEAGYFNLAFEDSNGGRDVIFTENATIGSTVQRTFTVDQLGGTPALLPFVFETSAGTRRADNRGNIDGQLELAFLDIIDLNSFGFVNGSTIAFFGDGGGGFDKDLDDLVIGIGIQSITTVPVPPAAILLLSGLFGLGALKRMRRGGASA